MVFFSLGIFLTEAISFIAEGGLNGTFPLSRSLFYMVLSLAFLIFLLVPKENMELNLSPRRPNHPQDPNTRRGNPPHDPPAY
jgi:hypothetical protein